MAEINQFTNVMLNQTDEKLIETVNKSQDYYPEAVQAAQEEILRRKNLVKQLSELSNDDILEFLTQAHHSVDIGLAKKEAEQRNLIIPETDSKTRNKDILYGLLWLVGGLLITLASYSAARGGGTYIATYGVILYGAMRLLIGLFSKKLWYGLAGLILLVVLGIGVFKFMSGNNSDKTDIADTTQISNIVNKLNNTTMDTVYLWNDDHISISIPNTMIREIEDSTNENYEIYWSGNTNEDILRVAAERILKSDVRDELKKMSDVIAVLQEPIDSLDNRKFSVDTTNLKCLADNNGYSTFYYIMYKTGRDSNLWGKIVYVSDKKYYYIIRVWTHPDYSDQLKNLINKVVNSFNIQKNN
jgi:hypothetical protein